MRIKSDIFNSITRVEEESYFVEYNFQLVYEVRHLYERNENAVVIDSASVESNWSSDFSSTLIIITSAAGNIRSPVIIVIMKWVICMIMAPLFEIIAIISTSTYIYYLNDYLPCGCRDIKLYHSSKSIKLSKRRHSTAPNEGNQRGKDMIMIPYNYNVMVRSTEDVNTNRAMTVMMNEVQRRSVEEDGPGQEGRDSSSFTPIFISIHI